MRNRKCSPFFSVTVGMFMVAFLLPGLPGDIHAQSSSQDLSAEEKQYLNTLRDEAASIPDPPTALSVSNRGFTELQYMIQLGEKLIRETNTHPLTAPYIPQSGLTCGSCHLDGGKKKAIASTFIGSSTPMNNLKTLTGSEIRAIVGELRQ